MIREETIQCLDEFVSLITRIDDEQSYRMWYRGQSDYS